MKKIYPLLAILFFLAITSTASAERMVVAANKETSSHAYNYKPTATATSPVNMQAQINELNKKVQGLEAADQTLWNKIFGKKKGALVSLEGRLRSAINAVDVKANTAINSANSAQSCAEEANTKAEVADEKATKADKKIDAMAKTLTDGVESIKNSVESMRTFGQWAFFCVVLAILGLFILSYRRKAKP